MIIRNLKSGTLRTALACGASAVAMMLAPAAHAQPGERHESAVYFLRFGQEIADGSQVISRSNDILMGRERVGDRSLLVYDIQNGATTVERDGQLSIIPAVSRKGPEVAFAFDYLALRLHGETAVAADFDTYVRPILSASPALGHNATWTITTDLAALGLPTKGSSPVEVRISRTYLGSGGQNVVLLEFEAPVFRYTAPDGETVIQWARGFAVTDPGFGEIHALATQHRASVMESDGSIRPIGVRTTLHGIERDGSWRLSVAALPEVRAAMDRVMETAGDQVHVIASDDASASSRIPLDVAARLDIAMFSAAENGANGVGTTLTAIEGQTPDPRVGFPDLPPGFFDGFPVSPETQALIDWGRNLPPGSLGPGGAPMPQSQEQILEILRNMAGNNQSGGVGFPDLPPGFFDGFPVSPETQALIDWGRNLPPGSLGPGGAPMPQSQEQILEILRNMAGNQALRDQSQGTSAAELDALVTLMALQAAAQQKPDASADEIMTTVRQVRDYADQLRTRPPGDLRLQPENGQYAGDLPGWLLVEFPDDAEAQRQSEEQYRLLSARLERELEEARRDAKRAEQRELSGIDEMDEFFSNNAYDYISMVGIIPTDLSRWAEFLMTQNVRELERLALTAGYPNLASALADAQNILRQSQDPGYRQWAMQAPSCSGPGGCGPSYLERWHMKTSIVALGDILNDSRDIFSTGGFSDIGISGLNLSYLLRDHALEDGDIVRIRISQFGKVIYEGTINLTNAGQVFGMLLGKGVASLEIYAVNEGSASPNTAQITVDKVVRGQATQTYSLNTGQTATLRIESGAKPGAAAPSGAPQ